LVEDGIVKCERYWPTTTTTTTAAAAAAAAATATSTATTATTTTRSSSSSSDDADCARRPASRQYADISVTLVHVDTYANFTVRTFQLTHSSAAAADCSEVGELRVVTQYQFTAWPQHGVPSHPLALLEFYSKVFLHEPGRCLLPTSRLPSAHEIPNSGGSVLAPRGAQAPEIMASPHV